LGLAAKQRILAEQDNCCLYCGQELGSIRFRGAEPITLRLHWDHRIPYAYARNNYDYNYVAACHICNVIKGSRVFESLDEAQAALSVDREMHGYDF
jgi:hypothetical protein